MLRFLQRNESAFLVLLAWAAYSGWAIAMAARGSGAVLITDDAMRLAEVRDLLNGQSWFDTTQWRMDAPFGLPMHWSRLIDAGIACTFLLFRCFLGAKVAETATLYFWPMLPFLGLMAALYRTARHLGGELAGTVSLALAVTCVALWSNFQPGRLDHDNVQLALVAWMLLFLLKSRMAPRFAGYAAVTAAISLTIGIDTLPYVMAAAVTVCVLWISGSGAWNRQARSFGAAFAATSATSIAFAVASRNRWMPACDTYSLFYGSLAILGGAGLAAGASFSNAMTTFRQRAVFVSALFVALMAVAYAIEPQCFRGPYGGMDAQLVQIWLSRISEAQPAMITARSAPTEFMFNYAYALMGIISSLLMFMTDKNNRIEAMLIFCLASVGMVVAAFEIREAVFPIVATLPSLAWCVHRVFRSSRLKGLFASLAGTLALALSTGTAFAVAGGTLLERGGQLAARMTTFNSELACSSRKGMQQLARFPNGRVAAFVDQGPAVLIYTRHAVIAGPYHRDAAGILDDYTIFAGRLRAAETTLMRRDIDYIVTCRASADWTYYLKHGGPDTLIANLSTGELPNWLRRITQNSEAVEIYAVDKRSLRVAADATR